MSTVQRSNCNFTGLTSWFVLVACVALAGTAHAAVEASLVFRDPTGTVAPTDTIEMWATLSLSPTSDALTYDPSVSPLANLPASLVPTEAQVWNNNTHQYDTIPFDSYTSVGLMSGRYCSGNFGDVCGPGEYTISTDSGPNSWFGMSTPFSMAAGESRDFVLYDFTPTDGSAAPGDYIFYNMYPGFSVQGLDVSGNAIDQSVTLASTCPSQDPSCAFTRTVAVPLPASIWLFGSGILGLVGVKRHTK